MEDLESGTITEIYELISKKVPDPDLLDLCPANAQVVRYDLSVGDNRALPALDAFLLTIVTGLMILFIILVIHYNCVVSINGRAPYRLPWICCWSKSPCELYFPTSIDEKTYRAIIKQKESEQINALQGSYRSQTSAQSAPPPVYAMNFDMRSHKSDSEIFDKSNNGIKVE